MREAAYWNVFSGGFGHTYGHRSFIAWVRHSETLRHGADTPWQHSLDAPGSFHMTHLRELMESRPMPGRIPDQSLIAAGAGTGIGHASAMRDAGGAWAMVYFPEGDSVTVKTGWAAGKELVAWWKDPREGTLRRIGQFAAGGPLEFVPPCRGEGCDWVLVLDSVP